MDELSELMSIPNVSDSSFTFWEHSYLVARALFPLDAERFFPQTLHNLFKDALCVSVIL